MQGNAVQRNAVQRKARQNSASSNATQRNAPQLEQIIAFRGKRNAVLTCIFPPNENIFKRLISLQKRVCQIKHKSKAKQIGQVLKRIAIETHDRKTFGDKGAIICSGYTHGDIVEYFEICTFPKTIVEFEYYYDDSFNIKRIRELLYANIIQFFEKENEKIALQEWEQLLLSEATNALTFVGEKELTETLQVQNLARIYCDENYYLTDQLLSQTKNCGAKIFKITKSPEFICKYGPIFGIKRFVF